MKILTGTSQNLEYIGKEVEAGKIVAFPTDTVYGLGASITQKNSIKRIFDVKERPVDSAVIVLIDKIERVEELVYIENPKAWDLMKEFWPGALTLLFPKKDIIDDIITAKGNSVGLRIPDNKIAIELIKYSGGALATPSANKTGHLSPTRAEHVAKQFADNEIDFLVDGGKTEKAIESTILDMTKNPPLIIRNGGVSKEQIEKIIGRVDELSVKKKSEKKFLKEIKVIKREDFYMLSEDSILLAFTNIEKLSIKRVEILSKNGDYEEAIKNLYDSLHNLLEEENSTIFVEELNENGLGKVIMERIQKIVK